MSEAVGSRSVCCSCLPCVSSVGQGIKERICPYWRMVPGLLALVASVVAIACAIIWDCPYLCFAFVPGCFSSIYLMYLGWDFQQLKSLSEDVDALEGSVDQLRTQNEALEAQNKKLEEAANNFEALVKDLQTEKIDLNTANQKLKANVADLEKLKEILETKASAHVGQLEGLKSALVGLQESTDKDHTKFGENLQIFIKQVELLTDTRKSFEVTGSEVEQKMKTQVNLLLKSADMLKEIFSKINEWKNDKMITERLDNQQKLNENLLKVSSQLSEYQGRQMEVKKELEELSGLKDGFHVALKDLLTEIKELKDVKGGLSQELDKVIKAAEVFQGYELRDTLGKRKLLV